MDLDCGLSSYLECKKHFNDGSKIYFPQNVIWRKEYSEVLTDSKGNKHRVPISSELIKYELNEDDIELDNDDLYARHKFLDMAFLTFQFNLEYYHLFCNPWESGYQLVNQELQLPFNRAPQYYYDRNWRLTEAMEISGYFPFYEMCFYNGKHHTVDNFIPDRLFFNYPNRKIALERIKTQRSDKNDVFKNFDYINATDTQLVSFMNDRFEKRIVFESLISFKDPFKEKLIKILSYDTSKQ